MKELKSKTFSKREIVIGATNPEEFTSSYQASQFINKQKIEREDIFIINDCEDKTVVYYYG